MSYCCPPLPEQPILLGWDVSLPPEGSRVHGGRSCKERRSIHQTWPRSLFLQPPPTPRVHPHPANTGRQGLEQEVQRGESCSANTARGSVKVLLEISQDRVCLCDRWMLSSKKTSTRPQSSFLKRSTMNPSLLPAWPRFIRQNCLMGPRSLWRWALILVPHFISFFFSFFFCLLFGLVTLRYRTPRK